MNLLICAATEMEIKPLLRFLRQEGEILSTYLFQYQSHSVDILITGVGGVAAAYTLTKAVQQKSPDLVIQAGIAGAFSGEVEKGSVWQVSQEHFADLGAEAGNRFMDLFDLNLEGADHFPFQGKKLPAFPLPDSVLSLLPALPAISVNMVSGNTQTIASRVEKYQPELESMEGAAFFYVCIREKLPFIEIRSVSNQVEVRDTSRWNTGLAIKNLNDTVIRFLKTDLK